MAKPRQPLSDSDRAGWRRLGWFWACVLSLLTIGGGIVQWLGPPRAAPRPPMARARPAENLATILVTGQQAPLVSIGGGRETAGPIPDPDPALSRPIHEGAQETLPRIADDGRAPMRFYAAGFDRSSRRPRVGLLLAGIGPNEAESKAAIRALPAAVSLAISPYVPDVAKLLATARVMGHEYLIALPLEPVGYPLNDPGPPTLRTSASLEANMRELYWALSRIDGYVGATGVIGTMRGERFAELTDQMEAVLSDLAGRGLLYVDPREGRGAVAKAWGRRTDLVIDDPGDDDTVDRDTIDARLAMLEQKAKDAGSALGLVMRPTPVAVARIEAWSLGLMDRGLALAPVSALALPPADASVTLTERDR